MPKQSDWLSLNEAAHYLGVHPTTLRRWANSGDIVVLLTPGGHRRFAVEDLDRFAVERRRLKTVSGLERIWSQEAISQARQRIPAHRHERWLAVFDEADRERKRELGRRLMGVLLQYISARDDADALLEQARAIGHEHGQNTLGLGLPLTEAMHALLFFRDTVVEVALDLPAMTNVRPEANLALLRRINAALNAVQLAVADEYDKAYQS
jgi:excisionase family DNA binding protein